MAGAGWRVHAVVVLRVLVVLPARAALRVQVVHRRRAAAAASMSEKLADGVYRIKSSYNSLAVEMADHIVLIEPGPSSMARAEQGIAEVKRLFPNKPIRYGVPTHHHIDHTGGIASAVAEGITIVVPEVSKAFYEKAPEHAAHAGAGCAVEVRQEAGGRRLQGRQARVHGCQRAPWRSM